MNLSERDQERLTHCCARSAMVMIAWELDNLMGNPGQPVFCSAATINLLQRTSNERGEDGKTTRATVLFARRCAQLAAALSWPKNVEIGQDRSDA